MKRVVLLDVDGVLADFIGAWVALARKEVPDFTEHDVTSWEFFDSPKLADADLREWIEEETCKPGFCFGLKPLGGAIDGAKSLLQDERVAVRIATSPWSSQHWMHERASWLAHWLDISERDVIFTHHKDLLRAHYLVDDNASTVTRWRAANPHGVGVLWAAPHNRNVAPRSSCWTTLHQAITGEK